MGAGAIGLVAMGGTMFAIAAGLAGAIGYAEWARLVTGRESRWSYIPMPAIVLLCSIAGFGTGLTVLMAAALLMALSGFFLGSNNRILALGLPYVGLTVIGLYWLRELPQGGWLAALFPLLVIWGTDTGAFFVGRRMGGPRLAPAISPNKTWSGFAGGVVFAGLVALAWCLILPQAATILRAIAVAIVLSLAGQGGDLFESAIKRRFKVKDSGNLIPGHGGLLDRIDALLFAVPIFVVLQLAGFTAGITS